MRQTLINIINFVIALLAAICGYICVELGIHAYNTNVLWAMAFGSAGMAFCVTWWHGSPLLFKGWRWLRNTEKINELDQRVVDLIEDGASLYEKAAEMSQELENETRNHEYNMRRMESELSILKDKYEILYRTLVYNVTNPENAGFDIMAKEADRESNKAKIVVDEHISRNLSSENLSQIKAESLSAFIARLNNNNKK